MTSSPNSPRSLGGLCSALLVAGILAALSSAVPIHAQARGASEELRAVSRALATAEALERPWAALLLGDLELSRQVVSNPPPTAAAWTDALRELQIRLRRIIRADLTPAERARAASLTGWVRALRNLEESRAARRTDALRVTREVERVLISLLGVETFPAEHRLALLEAYASKLPERWEAARVGLTTPTRAWARQAAEEIQVIERLLREDLPAAAADSELGERPLARLNRKLKRAAEATAQFRQWLIDNPGATGRPQRAMGKRTYELVVGALTGNERTAIKLRAELLEIVARDDAGRLTQAEARPNLATVPTRIESSIRLGLKASERLYESQGLSRLGPAPKVKFGVIPGGAAPGHVVRLARAPDGSFLLLFEAPDRIWSGALRRGLAGMASPLTLASEGLSRGASGEALLRSAHAKLPPDARMPFLMEPFVEGFGLYMIDATARLALPADSASAALLTQGGARLRLFEAARLLAALELHAEGLGVGEVVDGFRMRTGIAAEIAESEIDRIWHEPLLGSSILGYLEFRRLEETLAQTLTRPDAVLLTITLAIAAPGVRPGDLLDQAPRQR